MKPRVRTTVVEDCDGNEIAGFAVGPAGFTSFGAERVDSIAFEALLTAAYQQGVARKQERNPNIKPTELDRQRAIHALRRCGIEVK